MINNLFGANARGGAESVIEVEARALMMRHHEVLVVRTDASDEGEATENGVRTIRVRTPLPYPYTELGRHGRLSRLVWHIADLCGRGGARQLRQIIERERPDVVHTHNLMGFGLAVPEMVRRTGVKHVHTVHDIQLFEPSGRLAAGKDVRRLGWSRRAYASLARRRMGSPSVVVFPSQYLADQHERLGFFSVSRTYVLPNPAPEPGEPRAEAPSPTLFLYVGQIEPHKGVMELVQAFEDWGGRGLLEIVGSGTQEAEVQRLASDHPTVKPLGRLTRPQVMEAMRRASFLVIPSLVVENAPAVVVEAFAAGTPVVAAATGGIPEMVAEGRTGFLFPPGDVRAMTAVLERAFRVSPEDWKRLSENCRAVAAGIAASKHAQRLTEIYGERRL